MRVRKDELYYFLSDNIGTSSYVGIHGTAIRGDIENEFMDMSKEEKAQNIMKIGLINKRAKNLTLTCNFFGILPTLAKSEDKRDLILMLNDSSYINGYDKGELGQVMVVVAIPIEFIKSDNTKYFCGWIEAQSSNGGYSNSYCLSDYLFNQLIPPECIYGYYTYQDKKDTEVDFHFNPRHYTRLTPEERDRFIEDNLESNNLFKIFRFNEAQKYPENITNPEYLRRYIRYIQNNPIDQYNMYCRLPRIEPKTSQEEDVRYTQDELENMSLLDIDLSKVKPTYDDVINGKYSIRQLVINEPIFGVQLPHRVGILLDKTEFTVSEFEECVSSYGNIPENLYKYWYTRNKLDFDKLYRENIRQLQEKEKAKNAPDFYGE